MLSLCLEESIAEERLSLVSKSILNIAFCLRRKTVYNGPSLFLLIHPQAETSKKKPGQKSYKASNSTKLEIKIELFS